MAEDSDVPPLEDMTEVLKKVDLIREGFSQKAESTTAKSSTLKQRAKVNKNINARVLQPESGENVSRKAEENKTQEVPPHSELSSPKNLTKQPLNSSSSALFGGMKKGFLFSSSPKTIDAPKESEVKTTKSAAESESVKRIEPGIKEETEVKKDDIPYISPKTGKTESGLTLDEVQQAMSETKGLLDNQDWINDGLLSKLEKNEFLLKRFADPHFMKALQEFQTNPQAAMEKYKSNKEVERFLMEFCGLLGDHFSNLGSTP
ncbi:hypothetical protein Btru_005555 [Bulinus truncatus]|nr:hypothetical protein Btru_005555 [Bulinus truncatus]